MPISSPSHWIWLWALGILAPLLGAAGADTPPHEAAKHFRKLTAAEHLRLLQKVPELQRYLLTVKRGSATATLQERGTVEAERYHDVYCRLKARSPASTVAGTIKRIIDDGAFVRRGNRVLELDDAVLRALLTSRKAACVRAAAARARAEVRLALARRQNEMGLRHAEVESELHVCSEALDQASAAARAVEEDLTHCVSGPGAMAWSCSSRRRSAASMLSSASRFSSGQGSLRCPYR